MEVIRKPPCCGSGEAVLAKMQKKGDLPQKDCLVCGRPFTWRKKWEKVWDEVKYCSDRCRSERVKPARG
jgi:hypothetical protein